MKVSLKLRSLKAHKSSFFTVPLTKVAHGYAQNFYQGHINAEKRKQVYLNTLAVYAVNYYLKCLDVKTNIKDSNSWNPIAQTLTEAADLLVANRGKLECCSIWSDDEVCQVSQDALADRIGYVAVWFDRDLTEAILLGFCQNLTADKLLISRLQPLEDLVSYLETLAPSPTTTQKGLLAKIRLVLDSSWQQVEPLLAPSPSELAFGYRGDIGEGKIGYLATDVISWHEDLGDRELKLNIAVIPQSESGKVDLIAEIAGESLPSNLSLTAQEPSGETIISEISQLGDTSICLEFTRQWETPFNLIVSMGDFKYEKKWQGKSDRLGF